jgi:hypothetical protein
MPKSFEEELRACLRYFEKTYDYSIAPGTSNSYGCVVFNAYQKGYISGSDPREIFYFRYKVVKRTSPTITFYSLAGTKDRWTFYPDNTEPTSLPNTALKNDSGVFFRCDFGSVSGWTSVSTDTCLFHCTFDAEL